ncbi:CSC1-like protein 2 [Nymphon striatum]|nr:CSC1-like protein 2 [Nymphon striatum]
MNSTIHPNFTFSTTTTTTTADSIDFDDIEAPAYIKCNIYRNERNHTFVLSSGYAGIPENLLINIIGWIILLLLFSVLRKKAWNYGRIALVHLKEQRWTQLFYGNVEATPSIPSDNKTKKTRVSLDLSDMFPYHDKIKCLFNRLIFEIFQGLFSWLWAIFKLRDHDILDKSGVDAIQYLSFQRHVICYTCVVCFVALVIILPINFQGDLEGNTNTFGHTTISNLDPKSNYLWFHVALSILLLPIGIFMMRHFSKNLTIVEQETVVTRTLMITHIPKLHCKRNNLIQHFQEAYPEVEVQDIQFSYDITKLSQFDDMRESSAQARIWCERYYKATGLRPRMRPYKCGHFCVCCESCGCQDVDAIDYYSEEEACLAAKVDEERTTSLQRPLGIAFITFMTESMVVSDVDYEPMESDNETIDSYESDDVDLSEHEDDGVMLSDSWKRISDIFSDCRPNSLPELVRNFSVVNPALNCNANNSVLDCFKKFITNDVIVLSCDRIARSAGATPLVLKGIYKDHQHSCKCSSNPPSSSLSCILTPHDWGVIFAPPPDDIIWENLSSSSETWYIWVFFVNFILFIGLFFLTTPAIVLNSLNGFYLADQLNKLNPLLSEFIPTLILWIIAALLPIIVAYSDQFVFHWTRSAQNHSIMQKTFLFLVFMVLILPSLGLTSMKAFVLWAAAPRNTTYRWECIFLPNNGAFFVNYVITSGFIGTAAEIIRFPELFMYVLRLFFAKSSAEQASVRKAILWEFQFGVQYAWFLLIFAITMMYSLSCPLIVPFGLVCMFLKHSVDRYNIYFAYGPSKINKSIHATAINLVIFSIILLQLSMVFFSFLRKGWEPILLVSLTGFVITLAVFIGQVFFHWFKQLSPITYKVSSNIYFTLLNRLACEGGSDVEVPDVLENTCESGPGPSSPPEKSFIPDVLSRQTSITEDPEEKKSSASHNMRLNYGTSDPNDVFIDAGDSSAGYQDISNHSTMTQSPNRF